MNWTIELFVLNIFILKFNILIHILIPAIPLKLFYTFIWFKLPLIILIFIMNLVKVMFFLINFTFDISIVT